MKNSHGFGCLGTIFGCLVLGLLLYFSHVWLLRQCGFALLRSDTLQKADAIVVMAGGYAIRAQEAAALYREGWSPRVVLTREAPPDGFYQLKDQGINLPEMIDVSQQVLERLGVPRSGIWRVDGVVGSTDEEVQRVGQYLKERNLHTLVLVTSKAHSRRACLVFHHYWKNDFQIVCRYSRFDPFEPKRWWKSRKDIRELTFEWQKLILYRIQFALDSIRR